MTTAVAEERTLDDGRRVRRVSDKSWLVINDDPAPVSRGTHGAYQPIQIVGHRWLRSQTNNSTTKEA